MYSVIKILNWAKTDNSTLYLNEIEKKEEEKYLYLSYSIYRYIDYLYIFIIIKLNFSI